MTETTSNKEDTLSCPSPFTNALKPHGLIAKTIKPTSTEDRIAPSLNSLRFSCEGQLTEADTTKITRYQNINFH
jgi:hypothetical protein